MKCGVMKVSRYVRLFFTFVLALGALLPATVAQARPTHNVDGLRPPHAAPPWTLQQALPSTQRAHSASADWRLEWSDEFSGTGRVDTSQWIYDTGTSYPGGPENYGTGEIDWLTDSTANVFQSGGYLHIRAVHTSTNPLEGWTSGRIETQRTDFQPLPGGAMAVEASIQLPNLTGTAAQGYWPAFWMLGGPYRGVYYNWPGIGEIDVMESINGSNTWWGTLHCGVENGGPCHETDGLGAGATGFVPSLESAFHTYRVEIDKSTSPQEISWYVDGQQYHVVTADQVDATTWTNATDHGFFILLNVAMGGAWAGNPVTSTASGGTMQVDYVRVYQWPARQTFLPLISQN